MTLIAQHLLTQGADFLDAENTNRIILEQLGEDGTTAGITPPVPIHRVYDPFQERLMPQSNFWRPVAKYPLWRKH